MLEKTLQEYLNAQLFSSPDHHAYIIIDGATAPGLMLQLDGYNKNNRCLYLGELSESLRATAPHLIKLERHSYLTDRLLDHWGQHQGIYAIVPSTIDFDTLYKHFRTLLRVKSTDNQTLYFRYYDPRTLRQFLNDCPPSQARKLFGPVDFYFLEDTPENQQNEQYTGIQRYWETDTGVEHAPLTITPEPPSDSPFANTIETLPPEELEWRAQHSQAQQIRIQTAQDSQSNRGMLIVDIPKFQQQRLKEESDFIQWYVDDYMPDNLPAIHQAFKPKQLNNMIKTGRNEALKYGFTNPISQAHFVTLMWQIGANFHHFTGFKEIANSTEQSGAERIKQLYQIDDSQWDHAEKNTSDRHWFSEVIQ